YKRGKMKGNVDNIEDCDLTCVVVGRVGLHGNYSNLCRGIISLVKLLGDSCPLTLDYSLEKIAKEMDYLRSKIILGRRERVAAILDDFNE
ncbi:hypothetical protein ACLOJK_035966, partial [Asimina triloba]